MKPGPANTAERVEVLRRCVTFVPFKPISRAMLRLFCHERIPRHFGDD